MDTSDAPEAAPRQRQGRGAKARLRVAVVIPCYRERDRVLGVIAGIGAEVTDIIVVDDACPQETGKHVESECTDTRVAVVRHETNRGVGGATLTGYARAIELGADVIVKLDGDGQMNPALIPRLIAPVVAGEADYAKGNRFHDLDGITRMPATRIFGNLLLSFLSKLSSGYWTLFDPTNGFTAISAPVARALPTAKLSRSFFFESDILFRLNIMRAVVVDVPMAAHYAGEESSLHVWRVLPEFAFKHTRNTWKRILYCYFLRDFNMASLELLVGLPLLAFGVIFGLYHWHLGNLTGEPATAGTVILAALPIIVGMQLVLGFLNYDMQNVPRTPLQRQL